MTGNAWLPPKSTARRFELGRRGWVPPALDGVIDPEELAERWCYVVVDEIVSGRAGLSITPWPGRDQAGRLSFPGPDELVGVALAGFQELLGERRVLLAMTREGPPDPGAARALAEREVRIGDVYAVPSADGEEWTRPDEHGEPQLAVPAGAPIYDVTYDARSAARLAAAAAVAPPLDEGEASRFLGEDDTAGSGPGDDGPQSGGGGPGPPRRPRPFGVGPGGELIAAEQVAELSPYV